MKPTKIRMMVDEIAYQEAAAKVLLAHDEAARRAGTDPTEAEALHWILSHILAEHCALLFKPTTQTGGQNYEQ